MKNTKTIIRTIIIRTIIIRTIIIATIVGGFAMYANAQNLNGTLSGFYGSPIATQTINTGFGDSTIGDGTSTGGSELDAAYARVSGGNLYLFISGNIEDNTTANHINVFIDSGQPGQNTLNIGGAPSEAAMNGSVFSPGFNASLMLDVNDYQGTLYSDQVTLPNGGAGTQSYLGGISLSGGIGSGTFSGITIGFNNQNAAGVNGTTGTAANAAAANAVNTGLELAIPLSQLGNPSNPIKVLVDINGGGDNYLANQFLPGLAVGTGNVGGGGPYSGGSASTFNLGSTPGEYFTVAVPEPSSMALLGLSGLASLLIARRRK